jgi:hypothetical protein
MAVGYGCGGGDSSNGNGGGTDAGPDTTADTGGQSDDGGQTDDGGGDATTNDGAAESSTGGDGGSGTDATSSDGSSGGDGGASDGPSFDGNLACTGTDTACRYDNDAGVAENGVCQATNMCGPCTTDTQCTTGYGKGSICVGGACVQGNCHTNSDCTGDAGTPVCVNNTCTVCDGVTSGTYYVDPANGSDGADSTGSDMAGGQKAAVCAFKTIAHALAVVGHPSTATTIVVLGNDSGEKTFPLTIPANVVLKGDTSSVTVTVPGTASKGFVLGGASSGIESLVVSGTAGTGINAGTGSVSTTYLKNVTVTGFATGEGVLVSGGSVLTLDEGVVLTKNLDGLHVTDTSAADCANTTQSSPDAFSGNSQYGVLVDTHGALSFTGSAGTLGAGSIVATGNGAAGIAIVPSANAPSNPASLLSGVVAWNNRGLGTGAGLLLEGGAHVKVRSSYFGANGVAVDVTANASNSGSNDTSGMDLGTSGDNGLNTIQNPGSTATDAGVSAQNGTGICVQFTPNTSQNLEAIGNIWANSTGSTSLDCTTSTNALSVLNSGCVGNQDLGGQGFNPSSKLNMYVDKCTCSLATFTCQ